MDQRRNCDAEIGRNGLLVVIWFYYFVCHFSLGLGKVPFQTVVHDRSVFRMHLCHVHHVLSEALFHYFVDGFAGKASGGMLH